jgi:hypothetical protein
MNASQKNITICIYLVVDNALHPKPLTLREFFMTSAQQK